jgi:hypothetical protein
MEIRCGECATVVAAEALECPACGRMMGSSVARGRPSGLLLWASVAAVVEVAITLLLLRACR